MANPHQDRLHAERLSVGYPGVVILDKVSASIPDGKITALIGANGSGKSTLFRLILGEHLPSSGAILFGGEDITGLKPFQRIRRGLKPLLLNQRQCQAIPGPIHARVPRQCAAKRGFGIFMAAGLLQHIA